MWSCILTEKKVFEHAQLADLLAGQWHLNDSQNLWKILSLTVPKRQNHEGDYLVLW